MLKKSPYLNFVVLSIAYLLVALFLVALIHYPNLADERAGIIQLTNFEGYKPFQYRVLMPLLIRGIELLTPGAIERGIAKSLRPKILAQMVGQGVADYKAELVYKYAFRVALYMGLNVLMLVSFTTAIFLAAEVVYSNDSFRIPDLQSLLSLAALGVFSQSVGWILIANALPGVRVSLSGLILLLQPALAFVWDVLFFQRPTTPVNWLGVLIALAAIYLGMVRQQSAGR